MPGISELVSLSVEDRLLERARQGDEAAWEELFRECYPKVVRVVRRKLNPPMRSLYDSTDFASDVWSSLLAKSDRFHFLSVKELIAFLSKAAEQKVIDEYRRLRTLKRDKRRETSISTDDGSDAQAVASTDPTPSTWCIANERLERLRDKLDDEERMVFDLRLQNYPNQEIAERVGWHLKKVQRFLKVIGDAWESPGGGHR